MRRKGTHNIVTNHTIRKYFGNNFEHYNKSRKFKSKYMPQIDYWPYESREEYRKHKQRYCGVHVALLDTILNNDKDYPAGYLPIGAPRIKREFYSIGNSNKFCVCPCYLDFKENRDKQKSHKSLGKQKGCSKQKYKFIKEMIECTSDGLC